MDPIRLPKAIGSIVTNYRGSKATSVPEKAIADVVQRLVIAAEQLGKMPYQGKTTKTYEMLAQVHQQLKNS